MDAKEIGLRLKDERQRMAVSRSMLAAYCEIETGEVVAYEKGAALPSCEALVLCGRHGLDIQYILTGTSSKGKLVPLPAAYRSLERHTGYRRLSLVTSESK